jgi:hypothetical protein
LENQIILDRRGRGVLMLSISGISILLMIPVSEIDA